jgi:hypothetical protein
MSTRSREIVLLEVKRGQCLGLTTLSPYVSQLSRQCGILNVYQPYRPLRPVTGIALCISKTITALLLRLVVFCWLEISKHSRSCRSQSQGQWILTHRLHTYIRTHTYTHRYIVGNLVFSLFPVSDVFQIPAARINVAVTILESCHYICEPNLYVFIY